MSGRHNDMRRIADALTNLESSSVAYDDSPKKAAVTLIRRSITFLTEAVNANASNALAPNATRGQHYAMANGRVLGGRFMPTASITQDATNNATIAVVKLDANGAPVAPALASITTAPVANGGSGNVVLGVGCSLVPATGANCRFTKGQILAPSLTQNASGVALPTGTLQIDVELEGPADDYPV